MRPVQSVPRDRFLSLSRVERFVNRLGDGMKYLKKCC